MMDACKTCRFSRTKMVPGIPSDITPYQVRECHRRAKASGAWSWVEDDDWCGEFEPESSE